MHYQQGNINIGGKKKKGIQARCILFSCTNNRIRETLRLARTSRINKSSNLLSESSKPVAQCCSLVYAYLYVCLVLDPALQIHLTSAQQRGKSIPSDLLVMILRLMQPRILLAIFA